MDSDANFSLWLEQARQDGDSAALLAARRELRAVVAGAFGAAHKARTASQRIRRIEVTLSSLST